MKTKFSDFMNEIVCEAEKIGKEAVEDLNKLREFYKAKRKEWINR